VLPRKLSKVVVVLACVVGVALMGAWFLSASGPESQGAAPGPLAFVSPIGNPQQPDAGQPDQLHTVLSEYDPRLAGF
jgi:hypothetical protein